MRKLNGICEWALIVEEICITEEKNKLVTRELKGYWGSMGQLSMLLSIKITQQMRRVFKYWKKLR